LCVDLYIGYYKHVTVFLIVYNYIRTFTHLIDSFQATNLTSMSFFQDGHISTHANPTSTRRMIMCSGAKG